MDDGWRYTLVEKDTGTEFSIECDDVKYALTSTRPVIILRWDSFSPRDTGLPLAKFFTGAVQLDPIFSKCDLRENVQITIFRDVANAYSCRMTPRTAFNNLKRNFRLSFRLIYNKAICEDVKFHLRTMKDLQRKVRIWHTQCTHMFKKFQEGVERMERADLVFQTVVNVDLEACYKDWDYRAHRNPCSVIRPRLISLLDDFMLCTLLRSMAEGEALLRSCGEHSYNRAALALSSLSPFVSTFSKFALATRELDWIVDFLCCDPEEKSRFDSWEWCEERCTLVSSNRTNRLDALEDDSLEAAVRRQNADREALQAFLDQKLSTSHSKLFFQFLESYHIVRAERKYNQSRRI